MFADDEIPEEALQAMASQGLIYSTSSGPKPHAVDQTARASDRLSVLRPRLPSAEHILPYLELIDEQRWYSNSGALVTLLEERLSGHFGFTDPGVVTTANGTVGLTAALLAQRVHSGSLCIMPSWTFAATPHATLAAGLTPWFHDVDPRTWALDPHEVIQTLPRISGQVGAVVVVSPFGAPIDLAAWEQFEERTGIAVVVDAAAGFDTVRPSRIPCVVSLHATKLLGAGEGGFIATTDPQLRERLRACCNFGFHGSRNAMLTALNAKMSEYHAAVALAGLALWANTRESHARISQLYLRGMRQLDGIRLQPGYGDGWVSSTTSVLLPHRSATQISQQLLKDGIETRAWWGEGCHVQPAFVDCPRSSLPVTEELGARVLGLPHFADLQERDVDRVIEALHGAQSGSVRRQLLALSNQLGDSSPNPVHQDLDTLSGIGTPLKHQ